MASLLGLVKSGHMHLGDLGLALLSPNGLLTYAPLVSVDYKVISDDHDSLPSTCTLEGFFFFKSSGLLLLSIVLTSAKLNVKCGLLLIGLSGAKFIVE